MSKKPQEIRREGTYVVKAAESRPAKIVPKHGGHVNVPSDADRKVVAKLVRYRSAP